MYKSIHTFHAHARACVCAQNDLRSAHLHYTPINPKKVLAQLGELFLRTLRDKKVPENNKKNNNNNNNNKKQSKNNMFPNFVWGT